MLPPGPADSAMHAYRNSLVAPVSGLHIEEFEEGMVFYTVARTITEADVMIKTAGAGRSCSARGDETA